MIRKDEVLGSSARKEPRDDLPGVLNTRTPITSTELRKVFGEPSIPVDDEEPVRAPKCLLPGTAARVHSAVGWVVTLTLQSLECPQLLRDEDAEEVELSRDDGEEVGGHDSEYRRFSTFPKGNLP